MCSETVTNLAKLIVAQSGMGRIPESMRHITDWDRLEQLFQQQEQRDQADKEHPDVPKRIRYVTDWREVKKQLGDAKHIARLIVAGAFGDDMLEPAGLIVRLSPAAKMQAKRFMEESDRQHREFGGYVEGTVTGHSVSLDKFTHDVTGNDAHVNIPWQDTENTVAGWHSHPEQYEQSGLIPETEPNGDPKPSGANDLPSFDKAKENGHLSVVIGNGRLAVYDGRQKVHSEELVVGSPAQIAAGLLDG